MRKIQTKIKKKSRYQRYSEGFRRLKLPLNTRAKLSVLLIIFLIVGGYLFVAINARLEADKYQVNSYEAKLLPIVNKNLSSKIKLNPLNAEYIFNQQPKSSSPQYASKNPNNQLESALGGSSKNDNYLYTVNMPTLISRGINYQDNDTKLSFSLVPKYITDSGKEIGGRLVYPLKSGGKAVYTAMANGLEEDILLSSPKQLQKISYQLNLPDTLQARLIPSTGEIGIYSADPALYGNISFSNAGDKQAVMKARVASKKTHLTFIIPPPVINQSGNGSKLYGKFRLNGNEISLILPSIKSAKYPISIDPSVVVSSSAAFATGNTDDNISYPSNEISRGLIDGGTISSGWTQDTNAASLPSVNAGVGAVYDGYLYEIGGYNGTSGTSAVYYTAIGSGGAVGAWTNDTAAAMPVPISSAFSVEYNGYIYVLGGLNGTTYYNTVYYAQVTSSGALSTNTCGTSATWCTTSVLPKNIEGATSEVYNGYVYVMGGYDGTTHYATTYYAAIHADGSLGAWVTDANSLPQGLDVASSSVYNNYLYVIGGYNGTAQISTVYYAAINVDHSIGVWQTNTNALPVTDDGSSSVAVGGYLYLIGGYSGTTYITTVYYAQINADGSVGAWGTTTPLPQGLSYNPALVSNGYIYLLTGANGTTAYLNTTYYGKVDPAGVLTPWTTTNGIVKQGTGKGYQGREANALVVYGGYIYSLGGDNGGTQYYDESAPVNSDGSLGAWAQATSLPASYTGIQAVAYSGHMFFFNGCSAISSGSCGTHTTAQAYSSTITAGTGALSSWTSLTAPPNADWGGMAAVYNGYVYLLGGENSSGGFDNTVTYAQLTTTGGLAANSGCGTTWCSTGAFTTGRAFGGAVAYDGYLYLADGVHATSDTACNTVASTYCDDVQYAQITSTGALSTNTCGTSTTWCTTSNMNLTGSTEGGIYATRDYLYSPLGAYAVINANGSIGTWQTTTTFATARTEYGSAYNNGDIYIAGGNSAGTYDSDAQYAVVNNGGSGTTGSYSTLSSNLPGTLDLHTSVSENGYLYILGGSLNGSYTSSVYFAQFEPNGALITNLTSCPTGSTLYNGTWCSTSNLPAASAAAVAVGLNGYIYYLGGQIPTGPTTVATHVASINPNGTLSSWSNGVNLPQSIDLSTIATKNNYIYVIGGSTGSTPISTVYLAQLSPTTGGFVTRSSCPGGGTLYNGAWCSTTALPQAVQTSAAVIAGNYVYLLGGYNTGGGLNTSYYAYINSDGSIGTWNTSTSLPNVTTSNTAVAYDGFIYLIDGSGGNALVYRATLEINGSLGQWVQTTSMPTTDYYGTAVVQNGYIYIIGGDNGSAAISSIYYAPVYSIPRIGHYSYLINLGTPSATVTSISINGTLSNGLSAITYETAGSNAQLSNIENAAYLASNPPSTVNACVAGGGAQYVWLYITMDDGISSSFPDQLGQDSNITNLTINYTTNTGHPPTNLRLRQGGWFNNQILQPLDTCG